MFSEVTMSYVQSTGEGRKALRDDIGRASTSARAGALTYFAFALSIGFAAALIIGFIA